MGAAASAIPIEQMIYGTATETCRAICPYSKTKIFFGSEIRSAVAKEDSTMPISKPRSRTASNWHPTALATAGMCWASLH
jgi:hypothetical protein